MVWQGLAGSGKALRGMVLISRLREGKGWRLIMQKIEYRTIDKSEWLRGPWDDEPDKIQWPDEMTGLPCLIVRNRMGVLCGYVGIAEDHPMFGKDYDDVDSRVDVHGGLSFSGMCQPGAEDHGICHVPGDGEPDQVWWFGFDCAHYQDLIPSDAARSFERNVRIYGYNRTYRNVAYVMAECASLAKQLIMHI